MQRGEKMFKKSIVIVVFLAVSMVFFLVFRANAINENVQGVVLAKIVNEDNLDFDKGYRNQYLEERNNFLNLNFESVAEEKDDIFTTGAKNDNLKGYKINNENFAVELITCDSYERFCAFRINGVPTKKIYDFKNFGSARKSAFDIDEGYELKINSVEFDFCDNRKFCHLGYEGYNIVNLSIKRKA